MLSPVPGLTHLKVLTPPPPLIDAPSTPPSQPSPAHRRAEALTQIALEACFGVRPVHHLRPDYFAPPVRVHAAARQKVGIRRPVRQDSFHLRDDGEIYGTAASTGRAYAFTGRVAGEKLLSFRVL